MTRDTLIVPPYPGEFGWELLNWQARVRRLAVMNDRVRVVVVGQADRRHVYERGMPEGRFVFCPAGQVALPGEANEDHRVDTAGEPLDRSALRRDLMDHAHAACRRLGLAPADMDVLLPPMDGTLWPARRPHQQFVSLRRPTPIRHDVVLVPRERRMADERNREATWWEALGDRLARQGLQVATLTRPLDRAVRMLSAARLAVGASTGGLHLASLCGCPHYVWGSGPERRWTPWAITNRQRYETFWNPLGTPCVYDEIGWRPDMDHAVDGALRALRDVGLAHTPGYRALNMRSRWHVRRRLASVLETAPQASWWPWRVHRLVREHLV